MSRPEASPRASRYFRIRASTAESVSWACRNDLGSIGRKSSAGSAVSTDSAPAADPAKRPICDSSASSGSAAAAALIGSRDPAPMPAMPGRDRRRRRAAGEPRQEVLIGECSHLCPQVFSRWFLPGRPKESLACGRRDAGPARAKWPGAALVSVNHSQIAGCARDPE